MQLRTRLKRMEKELESKDNKLIGKIKSQIHQSYQQESDNKNEVKSSPFPSVGLLQFMSLEGKHEAWET